jgi:hypothetical protein
MSDDEKVVRLFKEQAGPGEPFWRILARDAQAALDRGDLDLAERLTTDAEKMKALERR